MIPCGPFLQRTKNGGGWNTDEFFATGGAWFEKEWSELMRLDLSFGKDRALDFGCGMGRLTRCLLPHFRHVIGVDASRNMISAAMEKNPDGNLIEWVFNIDPAIPSIKTESVDFILAHITIQHIPRSAAIKYLMSFARMLTPGGLCFFQIPSEQLWHKNKPVGAGNVSVLKKGYRHISRVFKRMWRDIRDQLCLRGAEPFFLMTCIAPDEVIRIFRRNGCKVIRIRRDYSAGENFQSFDYVFQKE